MSHDKARLEALLQTASSRPTGSSQSNDLLQQLLPDLHRQIQFQSVKIEQLTAEVSESQTERQLLKARLLRFTSRYKRKTSLLKLAEERELEVRTLLTEIMPNVEQLQRERDELMTTRQSWEKDQMSQWSLERENMTRETKRVLKQYPPNRCLIFLS